MNEAETRAEAAVLAGFRRGPVAPAKLELGEPSGEPIAGLAGLQPGSFTIAGNSRFVTLQRGSTEAPPPAGLAGLQPGSSVWAKPELDEPSGETN